MGNQFSNGITGALSLAMIAFSTVFMVLGGLTLIIYCVKYIAALAGGLGKGKGQDKGIPVVPAKGQVSRSQNPGHAEAVSVEESPSDGKLVAVISAALAASLGRGVRIRKISKTMPPASGRGSLVGWKAGVLLSAEQGMVRDPWTRRK
jgi:hypothetical protein